MIRVKCNDVRMFFSEIAGKSVTIQIQPADLDFFSTNGYISLMTKEEYDQAAAEVENLTRLQQEAASEEAKERSAAAALENDERRTHSFLFHFEKQKDKEFEAQLAEADRETVSKETAEVTQAEAKVNELIQKKSMVDRMVPYDSRFLALTGLGVNTLNDLSIRNYRVSDTEFSDFVEENGATTNELKSIAERGNFYVSSLRTEFPKTDVSQLWSVSIGLAKLQGDQNQISQRFQLASAILLHLKSTIENKMMAAEIMTALRTDPSQSAANSDLQSLSESLVSLESAVRRRAKVPKQLSAGVAATIMAGRRFDGTFPMDNFIEFRKVSPSYESAAILSVVNVPPDQLANKFRSFKSLFESWGYEASEDSELASAFLSISDLGSDEINTKMTIILNALKNYLEYPLVAAAILVSIPTLEANETLDLMEKAYSLVAPLAPSLQRSELLSLSVRMVHGVRNELVKQLDSTAKLAQTPVQFTYGARGFFPAYYPLVIAHASYYSTFSGMGGAHPAHVHGVGGFMG